MADVFVGPPWMVMFSYDVIITEFHKQVVNTCLWLSILHWRS